MIRFIVRRSLLSLFILVLAVGLLFAMIHMMPGDPASVILGPKASPELKAELNNLTDRLTACYDPDTDTDNCAISRTNTVIKALCAAAIGNGAMLVH